MWFRIKQQLFHGLCVGEIKATFMGPPVPLLLFWFHEKVEESQTMLILSAICRVSIYIEVGRDGRKNKDK